MNVRELMTTPVVTCQRDESLQRAAQIMWEHDCGIVAVVDPKNHLVGVVTDRDACMAAWSKGKRLGDIGVTDAMATNVHSVAPTDSIELAEARMRAHQVHRLPVVYPDGTLVGILSLNDLARHVLRIAQDPRDGTSSESIALTVAAIARTRSVPPEPPAA